MKQLSMVLLAIATLSAPTFAQPTLESGTRLRVTMKDTTTQIGRLVSTTPTALTLDVAPSRAVRTIDFADAWRIEISRGWTDRRKSGRVVGGLVSGAAFVGFVCAFSDGSCAIGDEVGGFLAYYALGAIPGVIIGGKIGAGMRGQERWEPAWSAPGAPVRTSSAASVTRGS